MCSDMRCDSWLIKGTSSYGVFGNKIIFEHQSLRVPCISSPGNATQINNCGGWIRFQSSFYLLSTEKKSWEESIKDCRGKGAQLVVVNSHDEQKFIHGLKEAFWIGLHDQVTRGSWEWVDGTPLTKLYWMPRELPKKVLGERCAMTSFSSTKAEESWNYSNCRQQASVGMSDMLTRCVGDVRTERDVCLWSHPPRPGATGRPRENERCPLCCTPQGDDDGAIPQENPWGGMERERG
ncbi:hypothetical protein DPEC_G00165680 [Dallia pectoralis]|uniref:Uncharacterized protein n=1 Tax=Dallia pectoralis TaxID=75939 RepID=A0ACC2GHQ6_DALPE|nr:hypothetical protein DPEC_G00165680 [Dallia pectoralis]